MTPRRVDGLAHVHLLPLELGGRRSSTPDRKWRCRLKVGNHFYEVLLFNKLNEPFLPGADAVAELTFLDVDRFKESFETDLNSVEFWEIKKAADGHVDFSITDQDHRRFA